MSSKNSHYDLDLSSLVEPIHLKIGEYICTLPADIPMSSLARMARAFTVLGDVNTDEPLDLDKLRISEAEMWEIVEEVLSSAVPPPPQPIRGGLLTSAAALRLLSFLASKYK